MLLWMIACGTDRLSAWPGTAPSIPAEVAAIRFGHELVAQPLGLFAAPSDSPFVPIDRRFEGVELSVYVSDQRVRYLQIMSRRTTSQLPELVRAWGDPKAVERTAVWLNPSARVRATLDEERFDDTIISDVSISPYTPLSGLFKPGAVSFETTPILGADLATLRAGYVVSTPPPTTDPLLAPFHLAELDLPSPETSALDYLTVSLRFDSSGRVDWYSFNLDYDDDAERADIRAAIAQLGPGGDFSVADSPGLSWSVSRSRP